MFASIARKSLSTLILCGIATLTAACQADYGADIHNTTSTPIFAQLMVKANDRNQPAVLGASRRLGPGDRGAVGPVRANSRPGSVYLLVDSLPNTSKPSSVDLAPGTSFLNVSQDGNGPLRIQEKP